MISPRPNSTADKIKKKKVNDNMFRLSNTRPINKHVIYKVIHSNSAVSSRCSAVLTFSAILMNIIKNRINIKFISPKTIN